MNTDEIKTMKISRTDLIKVCAAEMTQELTEARRAAEEAVMHARQKWCEMVERHCLVQFGHTIDTVMCGTQGHANRLVIRPLTTVFEKSSTLPDHVLVIVRDGHEHDCTFRLQLAVGMMDDMRTLAEEMRRLQSAAAQAYTAEYDNAAMSTKAREKLIKDALDSTPEGEAALAALKAMRKALK